MSATKPEAAGLTLEEVLADAIFDGMDALGIEDATMTDARMIAESVKPEVSRWLRAVLLGDEVVEAAARGVQRAGYDARLITGDHREYLPEASRALTAAVERVEALGTEKATHG